jgi:catechol 2,3-dioxygenase-like lactoylglutathione lyase family enzyme
MLNQGTVVATIAVKDLAAAQEFYGEVLGLEELDEQPGGVTYGSGDGRLFVYESEYAGTNKATAASWQITDIEPVVRDLKERGIDFEHYDDIPGMTREGDLHVMGNMKSVWFKDPDGNILNVTAM